MIGWFLGLGVALLLSLAGNAWLSGSRDDAKAEVSRLETDLRNARALEQQCSHSVEALENEAKAAKKASAQALEAARKESKGRQATGQQTLSTARSVPADECASIETLLNEWYTDRAKP